MKKILLLSLVLSFVSGCSAFSPNSDPAPNQAAKSTDSKAQPCNNADGSCAKSVSPSFH